MVKIMKKLSCDIETFSDVDLIKCGVYKYADSPAFEILLFAYSIDGGEIHIIDLAGGETLPEEITEAIKSDTVIKTAFNAQFERVCLSKHLGILLDPSSWYCTAVQAAELSLPSSLADVGAALGLERQKMTEGKDLIKYFCVPCKPTKTNGGRTRNMPQDAPEKWALFKEYCKRDVDVERQIAEKLKKYPISKAEHDLYVLDQKINDRGVLADLDLARQAIKLNGIQTAVATEQAYTLTGLENPNSVAQLKEWLIENGVEIDSLSKKAVAALADETDGDIQEMLRLRLLMSKTSVKKYEAVMRSVCRDSRVRGMMRFCGASRTGRWCLTGDHEVLTSEGWCRLDKWNGGLIACWNPYGENVTFRNSKALSFNYSGILYKYEDNRISQLSTPEHKMYVKRRYDGQWTSDTVENMATYRPSIPFTGYRRTLSSLEHNYLRVLVMIQADGHYTSDGNIQLSFHKERKVQRCKKLLREASITYSIREYDNKSKTRYVFVINSRHIPTWLRMFHDKTFGTWLFDESADIFFDELPNWDGYRCGPNSIQYSTCNKHNADIIQAFAHISGRSASMKVKDRTKEKPNWSVSYVLDIWLTPMNCHEVRSKPTLHEFDGMVYCAETATGYFLVRRNGRVWVTGNSGNILQPQNLPQNHLPDLTLARDIVKDGDFEMLDMTFGNVPNVLSELIRTVLIPKPNHRFIVADFSAIEARVLSWLAGEQWRLDTFRNGGDIYCASASQMFRVPVEKHGGNGHLRQKGKVSELACGYGGSVGALKNMGAVEMGVPEDELQGLINDWRNANPHIVKLWTEVGNTAMKAIKEKTIVSLGKLVFMYERGILFIRLPSGRRLSYIKPRIGTNRFGGDSITYMGVGTSKKWERLETFGGKLVENIVQAIARDLLASAMMNVANAGYDIVFHVHDEIIAEVPDGQGSVDEMCKLMSINPDWADGIPLSADGYECEYYRKD